MITDSFPLMHGCPCALSPVPAPRYLQECYHEEEAYISLTTRHSERLTNTNVLSAVVSVYSVLNLCYLNQFILIDNYASACEFTMR